MSITIRGLEAALEVLKNAQKQSNYAASVAINNMANLVQWGVYEESNKDFHIRKTWNKPGTKFGFNRTYANKNNLKATVYTKAPWMEYQEFGGVKTKDDGKYSPILVPVEAIQQTSGGRLVQKKYALSTIKADASRAKAFMLKGNWFTREGKGIKPLFWHESSVTIKPRFPFTATATKIIKASYEEEYQKAWAQAIKTAH